MSTLLQNILIPPVLDIFILHATVQLYITNQFGI